MRFTDNPEITAANMDASDILAGTEVSAGADRKFTLSGLATWALSIFNGLTLAGAAQTVKAAIDSLASRLTTVEAGTNTISKYALETYSGTSLGGAAQSVKSAIDSLFASGSSTFTFSLGGWNISTPIVKRGRVVEWTIGSGGTAFASFTPGSTVGTIPAGYRPSTMIIGSGFCRTEAGWTAVTMAPIQFVITSDGVIKAYGNQAAIRACSYLWFTIVWSL